MIDHADIVQELHDAAPPAKTLEGALAFLLRAIGRLQHDFPSERVGLLVKTAGENIVPYEGTSVSAGRLVYPDHNLLVKILSDVPTTNGASWQTEEGIPNEGHHGGYLAVPGSATPGPKPEPGPKPVDLTPLLARLAALEQSTEALHAVFSEMSQQIAAINEQIKGLSEQPAPPLASHTHSVSLGPVTVISGPPRQG